jgi:NAD(P)-dependent dehydrogenase (short-subunit alcohol dehydrogenase family)
LVQAGMTVLLSARDADRAEVAAAAVGARPLVLDVDDPASVAAAAEAVARDPASLDVIVNNAVAFPADMGEQPGSADLDAVRRLLETNLFGPWRVVQAFLPLLRASRRARIVNVSSGAGSHGDPEYGLTVPFNPASYGVSKAALNALSALTSRLAEELRNTGILVNSVCPGLTATTLSAEAKGARPVAQGAASIAWAALLDDHGPSGGFFRDGKPLPW